eukprot:scaffold223387_cov30-Tisochrysis_lutea.AAC.4
MPHVGAPYMSCEARSIDESCSAERTSALSPASKREPSTTMLNAWSRASTGAETEPSTEHTSRRPYHGRGRRSRIS